MLESVYPDEYWNSAYALPYEELYQRGYRGILFDIDNTLVRHGAPADDAAIALFRRLREIGFRPLALSNNKEPRVKEFCDAVRVPYVYKAGKPRRGGYRKAMKAIHTDVSDTLFVGDQLFTDIWGAKRCGLYSILVQPIHPKEEILIVMKRMLERIVLYFYSKSARNLKRSGSMTNNP